MSEHVGHVSRLPITTVVAVRDAQHARWRQHLGGLQASYRRKVPAALYDVVLWGFSVNDSCAEMSCRGCCAEALMPVCKRVWLSDYDSVPCFINSFITMYAGPFSDP